MSIALAGEAYRFGPFQVTLPEGWSAAFEAEEGVHTVTPEDGPGLAIAGYAKDGPVTEQDLWRDAPPEATPLDLAAGLRGVTYDVTEEGETVRFWMIGHKDAMIAVTLSCAAEDLPAAALPAHILVSSIRPLDEI